MDIKSGCGYPGSALSNFAPHKFIFDGVEVASLEGILQALKFKNPEMQKEVCKLVGVKAKYKGKYKNWRDSQKLYWNNVEYARNSKEYQDLLDRIYRACFEQSESFRNALKASGNAVLQHSIGRTEQKETILTQSEFCSRLMKLREELS